MSDLTIRDLDERASRVLDARAKATGRDPADLARELLQADLLLSPGPAGPPDEALTEAERALRRDLVEEARAIRGMSSKPLSSDSTLLVRELRDTR